MSESDLEVTDLAKTFRVGPAFRKRDFHAVDGVSFRVPAGSTFGLVGESGSGKSTVARLISRLSDPTSGTITFGGRDVSSLRGRDLLAYRRSVQIIFQDPYGALNPRMTVEELISEPWQVHRLHTAADRRARARRLVDQVGLGDAALNRKPIEFSGGQRQRIMIARALALEPQLIVADEPVSALDVSVQAQVLNLLRDLQDELGLSYLFISHDLSVVEFISDQIGVMQHGRLLETGSKHDVYRAPKTDYTARLIAAIPTVEFRTGTS